MLTHCMLTSYVCVMHELCVYDVYTHECCVSVLFMVGVCNCVCL